MVIRDFAIGALVGAGLMVGITTACSDRFNPPARLEPAIPWQAIELNNQLRRRAEFAEYRIKGLEGDLVVMRSNWEYTIRREHEARQRMHSILRTYFEPISVQPREVQE